MLSVCSATALPCVHSRNATILRIMETNSHSVCQAGLPFSAWSRQRSSASYPFKPHTGGLSQNGRVEAFITTHSFTNHNSFQPIRSLKQTYQKGGPFPPKRKRSQPGPFVPTHQRCSTKNAHRSNNVEVLKPQKPGETEQLGG